MLREGPDGRPVEVVVKVQRPTVARFVMRDLSVMSWLAPFLVGRIPVAALANPPALVEVFARTIVEELDFRLEAQNMLDVAESFEKLGQDSFVVPRPHPELVTRRVLVMERLSGFDFDDVERIRAAGVDTHKWVRTGMIGFLEGAMIHGVFHGDLHGGNLFVLQDGGTALLDFGIVGRLSEPRRIAFLKLLMSSTMNDVRGQVSAIRDLGALPMDTDIDAVIADLGLDGPTIDPTTLSRDELVDEINRVIKALLSYGARMPKELMLFAKNMVFLDAAIANLAPDVDLFAEITHLAMYFAQTHGAEIAAAIGVEQNSYEVDLSAVKASFGIDDAVDFPDLPRPPGPPRAHPQAPGRPPLILRPRAWIRRHEQQGVSRSPCRGRVRHRCRRRPVHRRAHRTLLHRAGGLLPSPRRGGPRPIDRTVGPARTRRGDRRDPCLLAGRLPPVARGGSRHRTHRTADPAQTRHAAGRRPDHLGGCPLRHGQ